MKANSCGAETKIRLDTCKVKELSKNSLSGILNFYEHYPEQIDTYIPFKIEIRPPTKGTNRNKYNSKESLFR